MNLYLIIAVILICLILEALYSGGEVALFSADINKIKYYARKGSSAAMQAVQLKEHPEWFISTALIGTNLAIIVASTLATGLLIKYFGTERGEQIAFLIMLPTLFVIIIVRSIFQPMRNSWQSRLPILSACHPLSFIRWPILLRLYPEVLLTFRLIKK